MDIGLEQILKLLVDVWGFNLIAIYAARLVCLEGTSFVRDKVFNPTIVYGARTDLLALLISLGTYALIVRPATLDQWGKAGLAGFLAWVLAAGRYKLQQQVQP